MATPEFLTQIDWQFWIPVGIAALSLGLTFRQTRRAAKRDTALDLERRIDKAVKALSECESNLRQCGREKDELRREKFALLEQIAGLAKSRPSE